MGTQKDKAAYTNPNDNDNLKRQADTTPRIERNDITPYVTVIQDPITREITLIYFSED